MEDGGVHGLDLDFEDRLDGLLDFGLVGVPVHTEAKRARALLRLQPLLGNHRLLENLIRVLPHRSRSSRRFKAPSEITSRLWLST